MLTIPSRVTRRVRLTKTALVADDLTPVFGLGAVTREVTELRAVVASDICSRLGLRAVTRHVALKVAVAAGDDGGVVAVVLVVASNWSAERFITVRCMAFLPSLAAVEAGAGHLLGSGALLGHVANWTRVSTQIRDGERFEGAYPRRSCGKRWGRGSRYSRRQGSR